jgi:hypothetical protein
MAVVYTRADIVRDTGILGNLTPQAEFETVRLTVSKTASRPLRTMTGTIKFRFAVPIPLLGQVEKA